MKAVALKGNKKLELINCDIPKSENGNVIVKVSATGICGTDLHFWEIGEKYPGLILGHELVGTVADVGCRSDLYVGQKVWVAPGDPCGECIYCKEKRPNLCKGAMNGIGCKLPGSFAEYVSSRPDHIFPLPDGISDIEAAIIEPCSVAYHCFKKAEANVEEPLLIIGAGAIGMMTAMWAKQNGVKRVIITDTNDYRLRFVKELGLVDETYNALSQTYAEDLLKTSGGNGFVKCIDCVGTSTTINSAIKFVQGNGIVVMGGFPLLPLSIDMNLFVLKELSLVASIGYCVEDVMPVISSIVSKAVDVSKFVTKTISLEEISHAFEELTSKDNANVKIVAIQ